MIHFHEWERIGEPKHEGWSYENGTEKVSILCKCKICGKEKKKYFVGHILGQIFDGRR